MRIIKLRCISAPKGWSHIKNTVVLTILAHSVFTSDVCWNSLGIFGKSSSAGSNSQSRLPFRLSFRFLCLWLLRFLFHLINVVNRLKEIVKTKWDEVYYAFSVISCIKKLNTDNCPSKCKYYSMLSIINSKIFSAEDNAQISLWNKKVLKQEKLFSS